MKPKFDVGKVTVRTEALCALTAAGQDADFFLQKHATGDWGSCDPATQEQGLRERSLVFSRYRTLRGKEIVVRTNLATGETSLYCDSIVDAGGVNHGFVYDAAPRSDFKYDSNFGPVDVPGLTGGTVDPGLPDPKKPDPGKPNEENPGRDSPATGPASFRFNKTTWGDGSGSMRPGLPSLRIYP
jgi:hypothetical protein